MTLTQHYLSLTQAGTVCKISMNCVSCFERFVIF